MNRIIALFTINKIVMKKNTLPLVIATVVILFFFTGCDKYHKNSYIGTWEFVTERTLYDASSLPPYVPIEINTFVHLGTINLGDKEDALMIKYSENDEIRVWFDDYADGRGSYTKKTLWSLKSPCPRCPSGEFESRNKINLRLLGNFYCDNEGNIILISENINGTKKSRR